MSSARLRSWATRLLTDAAWRLIPLQYAVLAGVGMSMIRYVIRRSNQFRLQQLRIDDERHLIDDEPPPELPADSVVMLEPTTTPADRPWSPMPSPVVSDVDSGGTGKF